ncbi:MAG: ShlB/FhaC/HecB family hemolysin secretion/activation protein [Sphingomonas sp.]|nr:ShlB/FhaC/HecB family hemolysin secretion/activation protein [Sphingomonas sp.]
MAMLAAFFAAVSPCAAQAQPELDRSDPGVITEEIGADDPARPAPQAPELTTPEDDVTTPESTFVVGAVRVEGATILPLAAFAPAIEPYLGRSLGPQELRALARAVAEVARGAGYGLATAWIPRQSVQNGILRVRIDEGRIDAIDARGPGGPTVARVLQPLADGQPVRTAALERRLLLAGGQPGVTVGRARLVRQGGRNILRIETRYDRVRVRATLDNWGTSAIGPLKARVVADLHGQIVRGDRLTLGGIVTPLQPREFQLLQAGYALPLGAATELSATGYLSRSNAGGAARALELDGDAAEAQLSLSHIVLRSRTANLWVYLNLAHRESGLDRRGARIRNDTLTTASFSTFGASRLGGGTLRVRLSLVQGLNLLDATIGGDPLASRRDGSGVFTKAAFWADYTRVLGDGFSVQLSGQGQLASRPLLASEEVGLGGRAFLRGYDYREFSGDEGAAGAIELRYDLPLTTSVIRRAQLYAYADGGRVTNLRGGFGSGSLVSAGGGVRLSLPRRIDAGLELGVPLSDGFDGTRPDPRLSFTLAARF